jgi:hypothetical protein
LLLERPAHAARIAAIACQWTGVENQLAELLSGAFGYSEKNEAGSHSVSRNWIALAAMRETETIRVRLKIINSTFGAVLKDRGSSLLVDWEKLEKDLQARGRERNAVVHGNWALSDRYPAALILEERDGSFKLYTLRDLDQVLDRIVDVWQRCHLLMIAVLEEKLAGSEFPGTLAKP